MLERLWGGPETLIVISTDLSHYHAYDEAKRIDGATLERIAGLGDRPESRGSLRRHRTERPARGRPQQGAFDPAAGRLQFGRYRGRQGRAWSAIRRSPLYEGEAPAAADAGRTLIEIARGLDRRTASA